MRRRRPQPLLVLAFVIVMGAVMYAKDVPVTGSTMGLNVAANRLAVFYREAPPPDGWAVAEIAVHPGEVWVDLTLPEPMAAGIYHERRKPLLNALYGQCPPKADKAWTVLLKTQDIQVRGLAPGGNALTAVSCRAVPQ